MSDWSLSDHSWYFSAGDLWWIVYILYVISLLPFNPLVFFVFPCCSFYLISSSSKQPQQWLVTTSSGRWIVDASLNRFNTAIPVESLGPQTSSITIRRSMPRRNGPLSLLVIFTDSLSWLTDNVSSSSNLSVTKINIILHMFNIIWLPMIYWDEIRFRLKVRL